MFKRAWHSPTLKALGWGTLIVLAIIPPLHIGLPFLLAATAIWWQNICDVVNPLVGGLFGDRRVAKRGEIADEEGTGRAGPIHDGPRRGLDGRTPRTRPEPPRPDDPAMVMEKLLQRVASGALSDPSALRAETQQVVLKHFAPNSSPLIRDFGDAVVLVGTAATPTAAVDIARDVLRHHGRLPVGPPAAPRPGGPVAPRARTTPHAASAPPTTPSPMVPGAEATVV